jgi:hypothetical protein
MSSTSRRRRGSPPSGCARPSGAAGAPDSSAHRRDPAPEIVVGDETVAGGGFGRFHDALAENFSAEEILEIVAVVVNMNVWTRIELAEGAMPAPA